MRKYLKENHRVICEMISVTLMQFGWMLVVEALVAFIICHLTI